MNKAEDVTIKVSEVEGEVRISEPYGLTKQYY